MLVQTRADAGDRAPWPAFRALVAALSCAAVACGPLGDDYRVGGHVRLGDGRPLEGVEVAVTWPQYPPGNKALTTDEEGWYSWKWYAGGIYGTTLDRVVVTPEDPAYTFEPEFYDLKLGGNRLDLDFTATPRGGGRGAGMLWLWLVVTGSAPEPAGRGLEWRGAVGATAIEVRVLDTRRERGVAVGSER